MEPARGFPYNGKTTLRKNRRRVEGQRRRNGSTAIRERFRRRADFRVNSPRRFRRLFFPIKKRMRRRTGSDDLNGSAKNFRNSAGFGRRSFTVKNIVTAGSSFEAITEGGHDDRPVRGDFGLQAGDYPVDSQRRKSGAYPTITAVDEQMITSIQAEAVQVIVKSRNWFHCREI